MSINSYAQNFEDVMLWRALGHIESGTYIDVGAQDPVVDSVSLAFHEHGWHGIHVEPTPRYAEMLRQQRQGDTVIQAAVGTGPGVLLFFEIPDTGISTADATIAAQHRERGFDVRETTVPCIALSEIFDTCTAPEIHWLKVDVEGFEQQVLSSWGSSAVRPWIVVVESTLPLTQIETRENWEATLVAYGYVHVYFDGLNRYYISNEHPELKAAFSAPPNVFDQFTLNGTASATYHKKMEERYQEKVADASAQVEQQKQLTSSEIERLTLSLALLGKAQADREQALVDQTSEARRQLESQLRSQLQREQAVADQVLAIQQKATEDKVEQARSHGEQQHALVSQHGEREQFLGQQLQARQQELQNLQKDRAKREQEIGAQLLASQRQAVKDTADQARMHREQVKALQRQHAEGEGAYTLQIKAGQLEIRRLEQDLIQREKEHAGQSTQSRQALENILGKQLQREQEVIAQLLAVQQQAEHQKAEQAKRHREDERALRVQHAEREQGLLQQQRTAQEERLQQERSWAQRDKTLGQEIAALQSEVQALHHAQQLQAQQHDSQLGARRAEHSRLIETCAAVEAQLKAEVLSGQQQTLRLHQSLAELQQDLAATHASLTWRMTKPLRALLPFTGPKKNSDAGAAIASAAALPLPPINAQQAPVDPNLSTTKATVDSPAQAQRSGEGAMPPDSASPINAFYTFIEPLMPSSAHTPPVFSSTPASTLHELLACHDQQFVICAYQTLFGREPDPEGLAYYLGRLRSGFSKIQMLAQLRLSEEGKSRATTLPKLDRAIRQHQRGQYPLIGWLFRQSDDGSGSESIHRKLRAIENQMLLLNEASNHRFNQMETAFAGLHHLILNQSQTVISILGGSSPVTPGNVSHAPSQPAVLDGLKQLSPRARDVYLQLKTAAVAHAEGAL
jgi:FkbM family methyltransferase